MEISLVNYLIILLGIFFFVYYPGKLYDLTVFSIPFTGTSVLQITNSAFSIEGIRPAMLLGALCLLSYVLRTVLSGKIKVKPKLRAGVFSVGILALTAALSLTMPLIINGDLEVLNTYVELMRYAKPEPLYLKFQYVTQTLYFIFGCLLTYYFAVMNDSQEKVERTVRIFLYSTYFVCAWGMLEFALFLADIPYPAFLFNVNSVSYTGTMIYNGRPRITSVSLEPSILAQHLSLTLPLVFWPLKEKARYLKGLNPKLLLVLILFVLILSFSTTAVFGIVAFTAVVILFYLVRKKVNGYLLLGVLIVFSVLVTLIPTLVKGLEEKLKTFSGIERLRAIEYGWLYFTEYPVLGIGWGVFPSWDLIICILTGIGIVGLLIFTNLLISIYLNFKNQKVQGNYNTLTKSVYHSLIMLLLVSQFSGFIYHSQYFWLILGLALAASGLYSSSEKIQAESQ